MFSAFDLFLCFKEDEDKHLKKLLIRGVNIETAFPRNWFGNDDILNNMPPLISVCVYFSAVKCFELLVANGANTEARDLLGKPVSHFAVAGGNLSILQQLDELGADFDDTIHIAARYGSFNCYNQTALHYACKLRNLEAVKLLCSHPRINVNPKDRYLITPLHNAAITDSYEIIEFLLGQPKIQPFPRDICLCTPYHFAASCGTYETILMFTKCDKFDVNQQNNDGSSPLHLAVHRGRPEIVGILLEIENINVNITDSLGLTPLHVAAQEDKYEVLNLLICYPGINVNSQDHDGNTPLHFAAKNSNESAVAALLTVDDINMAIRNKKQFLPIDMTTKKYIHEMIWNKQKQSGSKCNVY